MICSTRPFFLVAVGGKPSGSILSAWVEESGSVTLSRYTRLSVVHLVENRSFVGRATSFKISAHCRVVSSSSSSSVVEKREEHQASTDTLTNIVKFGLQVGHDA